MFKHQYIAARVDRQTYLKGSFRGKFRGRLDLSKSDPRLERYYDIEILEGEIVTRQDQLVPWMVGKEPIEFVSAPVFPTPLPGKIVVTLHYLNGDVKQFMIALKQIKLLDCHLSNQVYGGNEVFGTITGLVSGYSLHHDMMISEILEEKELHNRPDTGKKESPKATAMASYAKDQNVINPSAAGITLSRILAGILGLGLLIVALLIARSCIVTLLVAVVMALGIRRLHRLTKQRYGYRISGTVTVLVIFLLLGVFAFCLAGQYPDNRWQNQEGVAEKYTTDDVINRKAQKLYEENRFNEALKVYSQLLKANKDNIEFLYKRALCYVKTGMIQEAVADLRLPVKEKYLPAIHLHDSINPLKRRFTGEIVIRCNDGTTSRAKHRRGACSGHKGVKKWEDSLYVEYRKYQ